jgi:hypothetical protein
VATVVIHFILPKHRADLLSHMAIAE